MRINKSFLKASLKWQRANTSTALSAGSRWPTEFIVNSELQTRSKLQCRDLVVKFQISAWIYGLGLVEKMA